MTAPVEGAAGYASAVCCRFRLSCQVNLSFQLTLGIVGTLLLLQESIPEVGKDARW